MNKKKPPHYHHCMWCGIRKLKNYGFPYCDEPSCKKRRHVERRKMVLDLKEE